MRAQWTRTTKTFIAGIYLAALAGLLVAARALLVPLAVSFLLAYLLMPVVRMFSKSGRLSRMQAVALTYLGFIFIVIAIPSSFTSLTVRQVDRLTDDVDSILLAVETFFEAPVRIGQFTFDPPRETLLSLEEEIRSLVSQSSSRAIEALSSLGTNFVWLIIIFVTTFYLLRDGDRLRGWVLRQVPRDSRADVDRLLHEMDLVWGSYLRGQVILATIIGVLTGLSMAAVGLRGALIVGLIAGVLDLIPSLGPLVGGAISVVVALVLGSASLEVSNLWFALIVGGIFFLIQQFENIWLAPKILGDRLQLHPAVVVIGVLGALALTGILGAFIVIPMIASLGIINRYVFARMFDREPWPQPVQENTPETFAADVQTAAPEAEA